MSIVATFLAELRVLRRDHLPAALVPVRGGRNADELGLQTLPLLVGLILSSIISGQLVSRTGRYKLVLVGGIVVMIAGLCADVEPPRRHAAAPPLVLDVHHGPRHRPDVRGLHDHRPERGAVQEARRRDQQPDVLPPDRRLDRPGHRGHGLRGRRSASEIPRQLRRDRRSPAGRRPASRRRRQGESTSTPQVGTDLGRLDPGQPAAGGAAVVEPLSRPDRPGHPPGLLARDRARRS